MPGACLVADVACEHTFVGEAGGQRLGIGEVAAAIVTHIHDEAAAERQGMEALVEIALADAAVIRNLCYPGFQECMC